VFCSVMAGIAAKHCRIHLTGPGWRLAVRATLSDLSRHGSPIFADGAMSLVAAGSNPAWQPIEVDAQ
jgi:hypothetical protein